MCKITAAQIQADGEAVGTALENLADAVQANDPGLASELTAAGKGLIAATSNWQEGTALDVVEDAEQAVIVALNLIPLTSPFANLAAIVFAALNLLIANSQTQPTQPTGTIAAAHALLAHAATLNTTSQWYGKAEIKHHFLNPPRKDFEEAYNAAAEPLGVKPITI